MRNRHNFKSCTLEGGCEVSSDHIQWKDEDEGVNVQHQGFNILYMLKTEQQ